MICELYLNKVGTHTQLVHEREINGPEIFFPSGICESQSETTEDLKFIILLKLILIAKTKDFIKYGAVKLSITQLIC